jgi:hypothetical protein
MPDLYDELNNALFYLNYSPGMDSRNRQVDLELASTLKDAEISYCARKCADYIVKHYKLNRKKLR